ncbi:unnamed protein product [Caenorhabditis auriculariae]|uniref:SAND domain-containing protein n=1 Tax=Caenorhabditis auriculariae TaxID=2777116 RepID=A0A8S1GMT4_9PELO|nr:unnamed protein product [Caenorhabditis auriculariae]
MRRNTCQSHFSAQESRAKHSLAVCERLQMDFDDEDFGVSSRRRNRRESGSPSRCYFGVADDDEDEEEDEVCESPNIEVSSDYEGDEDLRDPDDDKEIDEKDFERSARRQHHVLVENEVGLDRHTSVRLPASLPVSCGTIVGFLKTRDFLCPGINSRCILINNEQISPKEFTMLAMKDRQKDWKSAIRINGKSSLRAHMEANTIDFFDHEAQCNGRCFSRNYLTYTREETMTRRMRKIEKRDYLIRELVSCNNGERPLVPVGLAKRGRPRTRIRSSPVPIFEPRPGSPNQISSPNKVLGSMQRYPASFWAEMNRVGALNEVCDQVILSALQLKNIVCSPNDESGQKHADFGEASKKLSKASLTLEKTDTFVRFVQGIERDYFLWKQQKEAEQRPEDRLPSDEPL